MNFDGYPTEELDDMDDDGTIVQNVKTLEKSIVGRKVVQVDKNYPIEYQRYSWTENLTGTALWLDDGTKVVLVETDDCCAYTALQDIVFNLPNMEHAIMGVGTTEGYTKWHIYANFGDIMQLEVGWSCGNPFYYGYGFDIYVVDAEGKVTEAEDDEDGA